MGWRRIRSATGQASVELVSLLPLVAVVGLAVAQLLLAGTSAELAGHAAEAGAVALLEGGDVEDAARAAVPGWSRGQVDVGVRGRRIRVTLTPRTVFPGLSDLLATTVAADAGPVP